MIVMNNSSHEVIKSQGAAKHTTNNQMELVAMSEALKKLTLLNETDRMVVIYSDSEWAVKCLRGEQRCTNKNITHYLDLVRAFAENFSTLYVHVPSHAGLPHNEEANRLAVEAKDTFLSILTHQSTLGRNHSV